MTNFRTGLLAAAACLAWSGQSAFGQLSLGTGSTVTQNFDTLASSGSPTWTNYSTLSGWYAFRSIGGPTVATYTAGTGSSATGALYSFGSTTAPSDRALGSVASGTPGDFRYGIVFRNDLGVEATQFHLAYTGEQWRNGGNTTQQSLAFDYRIGTNLTTDAELSPGTGFSTVTTLSFTGPIATSTAGLLDGNAAANRTAKAATTPLGTSWSTGDLALRWTDLNDAGNDHGLAVDDFAFQAVRRLTWTGGTGGSAGAWDTTATNWKSGSTADNAVPFATVNATISSFLTDAGGDAVEFTDAGIANNTVTLTGTLKPTSVLVSNTSGTYTFAGSGSIAGSAGLTKSGAGTLVINNANTYSGRTTIDGGTLLANNTTGSATGSGTVYVNSGGTLGGTGIVSGVVDPGTTTNQNVRLQPGGTLQPGSPASPFGNLTLSSASPSLFLGNSTLNINVGTSATTSSKVTLAGAGGLDLSDLNTTDRKLNIVLTAVEALTPNTKYTITIIDNTGPGGITYATAFDTHQFNITASNFSADGNGFAIDQANSGNQLVITFTTPVPEPAAVLGVAVGALAVGGYARRRVRAGAGPTA